MSKNVLVIYFSQSGQLEEILHEFAQPLVAAGHTVEKVRIYPQQAYPFPWKGNSFFTVMPDSVHGVPTPLLPFELKLQKYDLVVLGYQAWFLSPSIPSNSILHHATVKAVLDNAAVITITGARNMWISAMERIKASLRSLNARHVGNIALVDRHSNFVSFVTIFYWMLTGKKEKFLSIFPKPGVAEKDIKGVAKYAVLAEKHLREGQWEGMQEDLIQAGAVRIHYHLMFIESKARRIFKIWADFISKRKSKDIWLQVYKYYLILALFVAAPIILTVDAIFFRPFLGKRIARQKLYYSGVNQ